MPAKPFSRGELQKIVSKSPVTSNFRHLLPINKKYLKQTPDGKTVKAVPAKERIKWWNIVPGDQIRVMTEKENTVREVFAVNKISNRVYVPSDKKEGDQQNNNNPFKRQNPLKNIHYSGVQLFLGNYEFPTTSGSAKQTLPVFARRLGSTEPRWENGRWVWDRFATSTTPRLPSWTPGQQERIPVPWPEAEKSPQIDPTPYDTPQDVVSEVTYIPTPVPTNPTIHQVAGLPKRAGDEYLRMLRRAIPYDQSAFPAERLLTRELANPHSRNRKRIRYQTAMARQREMLVQFVQEELKDLRGRTRREARAEATFRWRQKIEADRKAELKKRWVARGQEARLVRKKERQAKKLESEKKRMRDLVLTAAKNQVVPEVQA